MLIFKWKIASSIDKSENGRGEMERRFFSACDRVNQHRGGWKWMNRYCRRALQLLLSSMEEEE